MSDGITDAYREAEEQQLYDLYTITLCLHLAGRKSLADVIAMGEESPIHRYQARLAKKTAEETVQASLAKLHAGDKVAWARLLDRADRADRHDMLDSPCSDCVALIQPLSPFADCWLLWYRNYPSSNPPRGFDQIVAALEKNPIVAGLGPKCEYDEGDYLLAIPRQALEIIAAGERVLLTRDKRNSEQVELDALRLEKRARGGDPAPIDAGSP